MFLIMITTLRHKRGIVGAVCVYGGGGMVALMEATSQQKLMIMGGCFFIIIYGVSKGC